MGRHDVAVRFEAQCPGCGSVVKQEATTGRYDYHGWANGCQITHDDQMPAQASGDDPNAGDAAS